MSGLIWNFVDINETVEGLKPIKRLLHKISSNSVGFRTTVIFLFRWKFEWTFSMIKGVILHHYFFYTSWHTMVSTVHTTNAVSVLPIFQKILIIGELCQKSKIWYRAPFCLPQLFKLKPPTIVFLCW